MALTDAFEFPDNALNSAVGRYDGNVYGRSHRPVVHCGSFRRTAADRYEALYASAKASSLNQAENEPVPG